MGEKRTSSAETKTIQRCKYARLGRIQIVIVRVGVLILLIGLIALRQTPTRQINFLWHSSGLSAGDTHDESCRLNPDSAVQLYDLR
jgi:hypothetical protein